MTPHLPSPSPARRTIPTVAALSSGALGAFLCWHYPIAPAAMLAAFGGWSIVAFLRPWLWLAVVPAVIPVIGFAPWTGWLTFEELDMLVLATAAGGYARMASGGGAWGDAGRPGNGADRAARVSLVPMAIVALFLVFAIVSLYRGIADAGGFDWGWFGGYYDSLNSVRVLKPLLLAVLLVPLLVSAMRRSDERATASLSTGLAIGSAVAAVLVLWERAAFPGILDFSADYRATALFWEMHVGGAALDGFLVLTAPFALGLLLRPAAPLRTVLAATALAALGYACLTTFSRSVYLALPVALLLLAACLLAQRPSRSSTGIAGVVKIAGGAVALAAVFYLAFRTGGYRTVAAFLGAFAVLIPVATLARNATPRQWVRAIAIGAALGAGGVAAAAAVPKGAYVVYAAALGCCSLLVWRQSRTAVSTFVTASLAAYAWLLVAAAYVAFYWGGDAALEDSMAALIFLVVLLVWTARSARPVWPESLHARGVIVGSAALVAGTVAIFVGGAYMTGRFATSENDLADRLHHWSSGISLLQGPGDWLLGKGMGRFPASYFFGIRESEFPGSYRLDVEAGKPFLILSGPTYSIGFGNAFRVAQRVPAKAGTHTVSYEARSPQDVALHLEICEKHLLYNAGCAISTVMVKHSAATWVRMTVPLDGRQLTGGPWYAPRLAFFSMAVESSGRLVEIRDVKVLGPDGRNLAVNGDFAAGMAHWFITSDRVHLPWHIKNLALNVLFDQGAVGLALLTMLIVIALWRLVAGHARAHPLAPFLAAALVGFLVVGMFDSLLDVPRVAFLFYLLLLLSLALRDGKRGVAAA